jgi:hypothetical protein
VIKQTKAIKTGIAKKQRAATCFFLTTNRQKRGFRND